jgi:hypothetical protein
MADIGNLGVCVHGLPVLSSDQTTLLTPFERQAVMFAATDPILIVAIDTEAEFDWNGPFQRTLTKVQNIESQKLAQEIFDRFGVRPIYLLDYAVASQPEGYQPLRAIVESGRCEIGAHLHPWINPPFTEALGDRTSYSHHLPPELQREKLARLTEAIRSNLRVDPLCYRAGRYGVGEEIAGILQKLEYRIDMSVLPGIDMRRLNGPDFRSALDQPYWFGTASCLLEIPATAGFTGLITRVPRPKTLGVQLFDRLLRPPLVRLRAQGMFARLGLLERIPLTPEGVTLNELQRLTQVLLSRGNRVFVFSYHSSSLLPGNTRYVSSPSELSSFLRTISSYLEFFMDELGGTSMTPSELLAGLPNQDVVRNGRSRV